MTEHDQDWLPGEPWVHGEAYNNAVFAPERVVRALIADLDLAASITTAGAARSVANRLTLIEIWPPDEFDDEEPFTTDDIEGFPTRLATLALDFWDEDLGDLACESEAFGAVPYLQISPDDAPTVVALLTERGYQLKHDPELIAGSQR